MYKKKFHIWIASITGIIAAIAACISIYIGFEKNKDSESIKVELNEQVGSIKINTINNSISIKENSFDLEKDGSIEINNK